MHVKALKLKDAHEKYGNFNHKSSLPKGTLQKIVNSFPYLVTLILLHGINKLLLM